MRSMEAMPNCSTVAPSAVRISSEVRIGTVRIGVTQAFVPDCKRRECAEQKKNGLRMDGRCKVSQLSLLVYAGRSSRRGIGSLGDGRQKCWLLRLLLGGEVAVIPKIAVEVAGQFGSLGAERGTSALEEDDGDDASVLGIGIGGEPAEAGAVVGAGAGFAHDGELVEVSFQGARGSVLDRCLHAVLNFGNEVSDVQCPLDVGLQIQRFLRSGGVLEIKEGSPIGDGGDQRSELQGGHRYAFTERAHATHAPTVGGKRLIGVDAKLFARNVVAGKFSQAELVGIVAYALEAEIAAEGFKIKIVRVGERLSQIEMVGTAEVDRRVLGNDSFGERGQGHRDLDRRARLGAAR